MFVGLLLATALAVSPPPGGVLPDEEAAYEAMLATQARTANSTFTGSTCADAVVEAISIVPWRVEDHPENIVWREKVRVTGCGHTAIENVNIGRFGGSPPWRMTTGLPGESLAEMTLQASTFLAAVAQVRAAVTADCQTVSLNDIYVAARTGGVAISAPDGPSPQTHFGRPAVRLPDNFKPMLDGLVLSEAWMEVWPFKACGHDRTLGVVFLPLKDHATSLYVFLPFWQQVEANGPGARPVDVLPRE